MTFLLFNVKDNMHAKFKICALKKVTNTYNVFTTAKYFSRHLIHSQSYDIGSCCYLQSSPGGTKAQRRQVTCVKFNSPSKWWNWDLVLSMGFGLDLSVCAFTLLSCL